MEERDLVAAPECIGNERRLALDDEFTDGSVTGTREVDPEVAEASAQGGGVRPRD
ncbi:hypothetical protein [Calidifontibacter indicus]|uniref:hypothetical protein n=1 Tax=Calidifontibacter indicus TaxID=419650 RepID=UPI003D72A8D2